MRLSIHTAALTLCLIPIGCTPLAVLDNVLNQPRLPQQEATQQSAEQLQPTKQRNIEAEADAAFDKADYVTALNLYESLKYTPQENEHIYLLIARIHENQGNDQKLKKTLEEAKARIKGSAKIHNRLGVYYGEQKDWLKAEAEFKIALQIAPNNISCQRNLGLLYYKQEKYSEAEALWTPLFESNQVKFDTDYNEIGETYYHLKKYDAALLSYERLLEKLPNNFNGHVGLINVYSRKNDYEKVIETFEQAFKQVDAEKLPYLHNDLGDIYLVNSEYTKALGQFEQLPANFPDRASKIEQASNPANPTQPHIFQFIFGPNLPNTITPQHTTATPTGEPKGGIVSINVDPFDGNIDYGAGPASLRFALQPSDQNTPPSPVPAGCRPQIQPFILKTRNGLSKQRIDPQAFNEAENETLYFSYLGAPVDFPFEIGISPVNETQTGFSERVEKSVASLGQPTISVKVPVRFWPVSCFQ